MFDALPEIVAPKAIGFYILTCTARPLGLLTTFTLVNFALKRGKIFRVAIAIILGLPVAFANQDLLFGVYLQGSFLTLMLIALKEFGLGLVLGVIASLPFYGVIYAGSIVDSYRGESNSGIKFEGSENISTGGLLFFLIFSFIFLENDGFWHLFTMLYSSHQIWPLVDLLPKVSDSAILVLIDILSRTFSLMIQMGVPLLLMLFFAEMFLMIASRIARRFGFNNLNFLVKNLVFVLVIPVYVTFVAMLSEHQVRDVWSADKILDSVFE